LETIIATEQDVFDQLKALDISKATGPDGISPKLLFEAGHSIVPSLTRLINLSLSSKAVPKKWKEANVLPLFKKGDKSNVNNYHPVSLLSCPGKILEKVVFKYTYNYIRDSNLLSPDQSGFKPGDSTTNQLSYLYHKFCEALDQKKEVRIIFCDISKAFDCVWHDGLLFKLKKFGIHGNLLLWFKDYLSERYQKVVIRGQHSVSGLIQAGVPQGSVLGPLLFLIYINDLTEVTRANIKLFADDTSLYLDFDDPNTAANVLNVDLHNIQNWASQWLIKFSAPKTKLMTCSYKKNTFPNINFGNETLADVASHKHLGLILSSKLSWSEHISSIIKSVSSMSDVLRRLKYNLDRKSIEAIYFSFIRPKLEYASHIWDNCSQRDAELLEKIQFDIAHIVTGARKGASHAAIHAETNWPTLAQRRTANKLKNFIKIMNNEAPQYLQELLPPKIGDFRPNSRHADDFQLVKARTQTFKNSFILSTSKLWNDLPPENRSLDFAKQLSQGKTDELYNLGARDLNIKHAQLRMNCSKLNSHLFSLHVVDSPECPCGFNHEDNSHYLLHCPRYAIARQNMFLSLADISNAIVDESMLLFGSSEFSKTNNHHIFQAVQTFIKETKCL
jgi:hypothetical protein